MLASEPSDPPYRRARYNIAGWMLHAACFYLLGDDRATASSQASASSLACAPHYFLTQHTTSFCLTMGANRNYRSAFAHSLSQIHMADLSPNQPPAHSLPLHYAAAIADTAEFVDRSSKLPCRPSRPCGRSSPTPRSYAGDVYTGSREATGARVDANGGRFADMPRNSSNWNQRRRRATAACEGDDRRVNSLQNSRCSSMPDLYEDGESTREARRSARSQRVRNFIVPADDGGDCDRPATGTHHQGSSGINAAAGPAAVQLGFRPDYKLGDTLRSPDDMVAQPSREAQLIAVESLKPHDFAFVRRSDGSYSYGILAYSREETLVFVLCEDGSTKSIKRKYWHGAIRLVNTIGFNEDSPHACPDLVRSRRPGSPTSVWDHVDRGAYCYQDKCQQHPHDLQLPTHPCIVEEVGPLPFEVGPLPLCQECDFDALPGAEERDLSCPPSEIIFVLGLEDDCSVISMR